MHKEYAQIQETVKRKQFGVKETGWHTCALNYKTNNDRAL
jgi:hypothetical protein